jgi:hypothetical protein
LQDRRDGDAPARGPADLRGSRAEAGDLAKILQSLPDLRPALASYSDEDLAELFSIFDIEARWNHQTRR